MTIDVFMFYFYDMIDAISKSMLKVSLKNEEKEFETAIFTAVKPCDELLSSSNQKGEAQINNAMNTLTSTLFFNGFSLRCRLYLYL